MSPKSPENSERINDRDGMAKRGDNMTDICAECGYRQLCEDLGYELDCECRNECAHYDSFLESEESNEMID